jgi:ribosomal protein S6--L-glutamate ligase
MKKQLSTFTNSGADGTDIHYGRISNVADRVLAATDTRYKKYRPSIRAQQLDNSKISQAKLLKEFMPPQTHICETRKQLISALTDYSVTNVQQIVSKTDKGANGLGVCVWSDYNLCYNVLSTHAEISHVLQPLLHGIIGLRVIATYTDVLDVYIRRNPDNFRHNITLGGRVTPLNPSDELTDDTYVMLNQLSYNKPKLLALIKKIFNVGHFHMGYLDFLLSISGYSQRIYLSEISLRGGLVGSKYTNADMNLIQSEILMSTDIVFPWEVRTQ